MCEGLSHFYHCRHTTSRKSVRAQFSCHITEISCIRGALLGSLGSSLDSAAHLANFFMSVSPEAPIDEMASALFKALEKKIHSRRWAQPQNPRDDLFNEAINLHNRTSDNKEDFCHFSLFEDWYFVCYRDSKQVRMVGENICKPHI